MILFNSIICLLIVARIMFYERRNSVHRPFISILAYIFAVAAGMEAIKGFLGVAVPPSISSVVLNFLFCAALFCVRGNVADLFKTNESSPYFLTRLLRWQPKSSKSIQKVTR